MSRAPERVICDTSPLFYLHRIGQLVLLKKLYGRVTIPPAVASELVAGERQGEDVPDVATIAWIEVESVGAADVAQLSAVLGPGEAEVLVLGGMHPSSLLIIDDRVARSVARSRGARVTGTAGLLVRAKNEGHIARVGPLIDRLLELDFRLGESVVSTLLRLAGELPK
jgi:hypothetical protein